jgi:CRISPR system Cascade subunit CasB
MKRNPHMDEFIKHLQTLAKPDQEDRAALAALRRAVSGNPRYIFDTFQYIGAYLPSQPQAQDDYVLVAALFAYHPQGCEEGNMGAHFAALSAVNPERKQALERRFSAILKAHPDDLAYHLRAAVSLLKSNGIPVNWRQLLYDMRHWGYFDRFVQRDWATAFWGRTI